MAETIKLGGVELEVHAAPLGVMKKLLPAFLRTGRAFGAGMIDEAAINDVVSIIAIGTQKPIEEIEAIPASFDDMLLAIDAIGRTCGLVAGSGETAPAESAGTNSTAG